mmetsp:Transcript_24294/g.47152  ORF Transcript_24294/g.47152 Transcript_24294/m.47152 type:complete len:249 (+) Transcript_24294:825-1571(+)
MLVLPTHTGAGGAGGGSLASTTSNEELPMLLLPSTVMLPSSAEEKLLPSSSIRESAMCRAPGRDTSSKTPPAAAATRARLCGDTTLAPAGILCPGSNARTATYPGGATAAALAAASFPEAECALFQRARLLASTDAWALPLSIPSGVRSKGSAVLSPKCSGLLALRTKLPLSSAEGCAIQCCAGRRGCTERVAKSALLPGTVARFSTRTPPLLRSLISCCSACAFRDCCMALDPDNPMSPCSIVFNFP